MARNSFDWENEGLTLDSFKLRAGEGIGSSNKKYGYGNQQNLLGQKRSNVMGSSSSSGYSQQQDKLATGSHFSQQQTQLGQQRLGQDKLASAGQLSGGQQISGGQYSSQQQQQQPLFNEKRTVQLQEGEPLQRAQLVDIGGTTTKIPIQKTTLPESMRMEEAMVTEIPKSKQFQLPAQKVVTVPTKEIVEVPETLTREVVEKKIIEVPSKKTIDVPTTTYVEVPTTKIVPVQTTKQVEVETIKKIEVPTVRTEQIQTTRRVEIPGSKQVLVDSNDVVEIDRNAQGIQSRTIGISDVNVLPPQRGSKSAGMQQDRNLPMNSNLNQKLPQDRNLGMNSNLGMNQKVPQGEGVRQTQ